MTEKDAVIVGARCAGSTLAMALAQRGWDVLLVDQDTFPSETVSTHFLYPNTIARLDQLGVLDRLLSRHEVPFVANRMIGLGHEIAGPSRRSMASTARSARVAPHSTRRSWRRHSQLAPRAASASVWST
jgi:2-polyprenyl-6-methoxyphenol hydroxylase-like FAD-dependent oxidoreductase